MNLFRWLQHSPKASRGFHAGETATRWAQGRFPEETRTVAAYVADPLCQQAGLRFAEIEPDRRFIENLPIEEETAEIVMNMEEELGIRIPAADTSGLVTITDLVEHLRGRLSPLVGAIVDPS